MDPFHYRNHELYAEKVRVADLADQYGTPCYIYSRATIENNWRAFNTAFANYPHRICYAVKANSNLAILNLLAKLNSGFDIVSQGELERVLIAGGNPKNIIFSGVGKQTSEIMRALEVGIFCFNLESESELERLNYIATQQKKIASIALRINPNIDARTHRYISTGLHENKFGIEISQVIQLIEKIKKMPNLNLIGIGCHIGSQLIELAPFLEALDSLLELVTKLTESGIKLNNIDIGGGLGICYRDEKPPLISDYVAAIRKRVEPTKLEIILEPGRVIVANAGILLTKVEYLKQTAHKNFAIVDAGMNDLIRPALYESWQNIIPAQLSMTSEEKVYDIVGPVCESADYLGKDRQLSLKTADLLAICSAGAYGFSMSSNYNSRPRIAEIMVDGNDHHLIRVRESFNDLYAHEKMI
ncbi:MAG: diaminopimelate decarboxylase [Gammaproteobacteria bacterium]